jgi:ribosomal protein S18 acetylase RimI-like enzyme
VPACGNFLLAAFRTTRDGKTDNPLMAMPASISRLAVYYTRYGFGSTVRRAGQAARRVLFSGRMVLFHCDLSALSSPAADLPTSLKVEQHKNQADLSPHDLQAITSFWNPKLARRKIKERFGLGASLWLIKAGEKLAGYGWTLQGRTVDPHYFPLGPDDAHLFDFYVFPEYRGRGINPLLVTYILRELAGHCRGRSFIEGAEWNQAQLASLQRTPFHRLGLARKITFFRHTIVFWTGDKIVEQQHKEELDTASVARAAVKAPAPQTCGLEEITPVGSVDCKGLGKGGDGRKDG